MARHDEERGESPPGAERPSPGPPEAQGHAGPHEEQGHVPDKEAQHGGDLGRGAGVERNRNQGGFDGKR